MAAATLGVVVVVVATTDRSLHARTTVHHSNSDVHSTSEVMRHDQDRDGARSGDVKAPH